MKRWWKKHRIRFVVAVPLTVISSIIRLNSFVGLSFWDNVYMGIFTFVIILLLWEIFFRIQDSLERRIPFSQNFIKRLIIQSLCNALVLLATRISGVYLVIDHLPFQLNNFNYVMLVVIDTTVGITLTLAFAVAYFIARWKEGIIRNERLSKEQAQMRYHNLRNRVNPHFLFNALSALDGLIKTEPELASKFLQHLSKVYRYSLQYEEKESVSLDTEYGIFKHFTSLLDIRYGSTLSIQVQFTGEALDKGIVPLTLEMLTENALKHNEISEQFPLYIKIYNKGDELVIENTLRKKKTMENSNGKGLQQLQNLYGYLSTQPFAVEETSTHFIVKLPLL